jgi:PhnB protein
VGSAIAAKASRLAVFGTCVLTIDAGATVSMPIQDVFWGSRYGQLKDPFGHTWSIGSPLKS